MQLTYDESLELFQLRQQLGLSRAETADLMLRLLKNYKTITAEGLREDRALVLASYDVPIPGISKT